MDDARPAPADNRRLIVRLATSTILKAMAALADRHEGDMIQMLVFTGVWAANSEHMNETGRYASLYDIMPDSQRRPISLADLQAALRMPPDIVERYVDRLIALGMVESRPTGLVVPSAVFKQAEQLDSANELYIRMTGLIAGLRAAGFSVGEPD